jgi:hypothetical protein
MRYPGNYGFIPHTLSEDGDPCDVIIANQRGVVPGGVVAVAREHLAAACDEQATPRQAARLVFTRGLLALAQREHRAACADLRAAAEAFEACADPEADAARLALARAQIAQGEPAGALLTLDALARQASCATFRGSARALAEQLRTPPGPTAH